MRNYELLMILSPEVAEEDVPATLDRVAESITAKGGAVTETNRWGRRKLAYPINRFTEGNYVLTLVQLEPEATAELEANLRISERILRHLLVRLED